jgi:hypothetical protein
MLSKSINLNYLIIDNSSFFLLAVAPIVIYKNSDLDKLEILKDNKGKSGIYRWVNNDFGKSYIGSSTNLANRLYLYYNVKYLMKNNWTINKALLKYGYANFSLEILEYCEPDNCIKREQYYIDLLKPEYNILKIAGSPLGYIHSEESKNKISDGMRGNKNAENSLGRQRPKGAGSPSVQIEVLDLETGTKTVYPSMNETGRALGVPTGSIQMYFSRNTSKPYKGKFLLRKL